MYGMIEKSPTLLRRSQYVPIYCAAMIEHPMNAECDIELALYFPVVLNMLLLTVSPCKYSRPACIHLL